MLCHGRGKRHLPIPKDQVSAWPLTAATERVPPGRPRSLVAASERSVIREGPCSVMAAGKGICRFQRIRFRPALNGRDGARPSRGGHGPSWPRANGGPCSVMAAAKGICRFQRIRFRPALNGRDGARPSRGGHGPSWPRPNDPSSGGGPCSVMAAAKGICRF